MLYLGFTQQGPQEWGQKSLIRSRGKTVVDPKDKAFFVNW